MSAPHARGCRCGAVRCPCNAEARFWASCQGRDCQYASGGPFAVIAMFAAAGVTFQGTASTYTVTRFARTPQ